MAPVVIEARGVSKTFRVPLNRVDSLKERVTRPGSHRGFRDLNALRDVSFDVHDGEFFGIVGRNGSGKSTLLKVLASIYRADTGRVRMAGRLAPFIELGVGFNPELTSRENVVLNGVLMGLTRREARRRLDDVLDFAELRDFADLKLKNYSSGMMVRLAFAIMVQADADIMLIDEVLAVGDAAFQQKCLDVFRAKRRAGRTIVLVTHDMSAVQSMCDRAMLLHDGAVRHVGDPEETALGYFRLNFAGPAGTAAGEGGVPDVNASLVDAWLTDADGRRVENVEQGEPIGFNVVFEARRRLDAPEYGFHFVDADGAPLFGFTRRSDPVEEGRRVRIAGRIDNVLLPGRYGVLSLVARDRERPDAGIHALRLLEFVVYGTRPGPGRVEVGADVEAVVE